MDHPTVYTHRMCVRLLLGWHGARVCIPGQEEGTSDRMHASRKARTSFGKGDCSGEGWGSRTGSRPSNAQTNARLVCFSRHSESRPPLMETRGKKTSSNKRCKAQGIRWNIAERKVELNNLSLLFDWSDHDKTTFTRVRNESNRRRNAPPRVVRMKQFRSVRRRRQQLRYVFITQRTTERTNERFFHDDDATFRPSVISNARGEGEKEKSEPKRKTGSEKDQLCVTIKWHMRGVWNVRSAFEALLFAPCSNVVQCLDGILGARGGELAEVYRGNNLNTAW